METIVLERHIVTTPLNLNPTVLLNSYRPATYHQARYKSNLLITYLPNVPATTAGQAWLSVQQLPIPGDATPAAGQLTVYTPIWRKCSLNVPKQLLNTRQWLRAGDGEHWLSTNNTQGTIVISVTLQACASLVSTAPLVEPERPLEIHTEAGVGPRLAGFSLCYYGEMYPMISSTGGQVINIDLSASTGWTTTALYVRTPENKDYVVVRYGFAGFTFRYNSANANLSWRGNSDVIKTYSNTNNSSSGDKPNYFGSWAIIHGSTSWWCETRPDSYNPGNPPSGSGNAYTPMYRPYCVLLLYYDYGNVRLFDPGTFSLLPDITPSVDQPVPGAACTVGKRQRLTLNGALHQLLSSAKWHPDVREQDKQLKRDLLSWETVRRDELRAADHQETSCPDCTEV